MRVLLVVNSFASSVTARNTVIVHRTLAAQHEVEVVETNRRGHATRFAHDAARRGVDVVVGYGGDGTLNEVATGIAGTDTALGVLPGGSTNVFARTLGIPNDPVAAADYLVAGLNGAAFRPIGLGRVNGRYFCFHAGIGFDAAVVRAVEQHGSLKRWIGHPLFIWAGLTTWSNGYPRRAPSFSLTGKRNHNDLLLDDFSRGDTVHEDPVHEDLSREHFSCDDGYFTIVLNTNPYTYLGNIPLDLSTQATLERGLVAVTFRTLRFLPVMSTVIAALRGTAKPNRHLAQWTDLDALTVTALDAEFPYQLDGDYLGTTTDLSFDFVKDAVQLVQSTRPRWVSVAETAANG